METSNSPSSPRRWAFRGAALLVAVSPFFIAEGLFAILGFGEPDLSEDPFVGFKNVRPLFHLNEAGDRYEIVDEAKLDWFYPVSFPAKKDADAYRIFCVGGSTVAGRPYTVETAFSSWLELYLKHNAPDTDWQVVNCGGVSYASYRLVPIMEEIVQNYDADLIILYTGHNEFLEDRTYEHIKNLPLALTRPYEWASKLRTFNVIRRTYLEKTGKIAPSVMESRPILEEEVDALLEHKGGMEIYHRDPEWHASVFEHFRYNLDRMCAIATKGGVPMMIMNPSCNLANTPPFKSEHRADLDEKTKAEFIELMDMAGMAFREGALERAIPMYEEVIKLDPMYAMAHYQLGRAHDYGRNFKQAYQHYIDAKDLDVCPLRMLEPMHAILKEVAERHGAHWVDVRAAVEGIVESGIPGENEFLDHVHPNPAGHQFFAKLLIEAMADMGLVTLQDGWITEGGPEITPDLSEEEAKAIYAEFEEAYNRSVGPSVDAYLEGLPKGYWDAGTGRLNNLRHWAQGRSEAEPPVEPTRKNPR